MTYWRKIFVRNLLKLYPSAWRAEYGEEMSSMLLAQPLTFGAACNVLINAVREHLRHPGPRQIGFIILAACRSLWILWHPTARSPAGWERFVWIDDDLIFATAFLTGLWTSAREGTIEQGAMAGFWAVYWAVWLPNMAFGFAPHLEGHFWRFWAIGAFTTGGAAAGWVLHRVMPQLRAGRS